MRSLKDVLEIRAYFFGDEDQKKQVYEQMIIPYFAKDKIPFHAERDWFGGPNYRIVTTDQKLNIDAFKREFTKYCLEHFGQLSQQQIQQNLEAYINHTHTVSQMERRENKEININSHLQVDVGPIDEAYVKNRFNSFQHFRLHTELLFTIQTFLNKHIHYFSQLLKEEQLTYTARALYDVLPLSKYEEQYAVLVYISNIEGVFAIAKSLGIKERYLQIYDRMYTSLSPNIFFSKKGYTQHFGKDWRKLLQRVHKKIVEQLPLLKEDEDDYYSHKEQYELLLKNITDIDSDFHNELSEKNLERLLQHEEHQVFKVLINLVYKAIHMLGISFNEKNAACYFVCRYVLERNNTSWEAILEKRGEDFVFEDKN